jgi:spermidine/putrescine transport system ATP-binding protein
MSDEICIMRQGQIIQSGSPRELYDEPRNRYVADFVGKTNFFSGKVTELNGSRVTIKTDSNELLIGTQPKGATAMIIGNEASVAVRPGMISISAIYKAKNDSISICGQVMNTIFLGENSEYLINTEGHGEVMVSSPKSAESSKRTFKPGDPVSLSWSPELALVLGDT